LQRPQPEVRVKTIHITKAGAAPTRQAIETKRRDQD
jgi:hypothetical protein